MTKQFLKGAIFWGFFLWLTGYVLGIVLFAIIPHSLIGWVIMPIGILITLWVLLKKVKIDPFRYYVWLAIIWLVIAVVCDYIFLVQLFRPGDGYYKFDVYLYYYLTFVLPLLIGWKNTLRK